MATFEWPVDKLGLINSALSECGDNLVNVADDGSAEWNTTSPAYERAIAYMMENHGWSSDTLVATLTASATAPSDDQFDTAYDFPEDFVHLLWVRLADAPVVYDILNNQVVLNAQGGPPPPSPAVTPGVVTIKYVRQNSAVQHGTPTFVASLQLFVMSAIYRGLHEDTGEADKMWQMARLMLQEARTRHDQQKPKRAMFNSKIMASRRVRRPWPSTPTGWGGTGIPG